MAMQHVARRGGAGWHTWDLPPRFGRGGSLLVVVRAFEEFRDIAVDLALRLLELQR